VLPQCCHLNWSRLGGAALPLQHALYTSLTVAARRRRAAATRIREVAARAGAALPLHQTPSVAARRRRAAAAISPVRRKCGESKWVAARRRRAAAFNQEMEDRDVHFFRSRLEGAALPHSTALSRLGGAALPLSQVIVVEDPYIGRWSRLGGAALPLNTRC